MSKDLVLGIITSVVFSAAMVSSASANVTVFNDFGPGHDGWDYNYAFGWSVAGDSVPEQYGQYGIEQAMGFTSTSSGVVTDIWVGMTCLPGYPLPNEVTLRLARNPHGDPPTSDDILEEWTFDAIESWAEWRQPHHVVGDGSASLEQGASYWLWAVGGETTMCAWCLCVDYHITCPHTLRREGEDWLPISMESASVFRVDVAAPTSAVETTWGEIKALYAR